MLPLAATGRAQAPGGVLRGVVVSSDGAPVPGAQVSSSEAGSATTDSRGRFALAIQAWPATVTARAAGFAPLTREVEGGWARLVLSPAPLAETVTVAATARNQATTTVPVLTQIMGSERIAAQAPVNLDSIVRDFPALGTFRRSTSLNSHPTTQGVSLLGTGTSGASRALVLLDGLPLNDAFGGWIDWLRVPAAEIAELTVVEGGASPLYGNSALAGIVEVARKAPNAPQIALRAGGGEQDTAAVDSFSAAGGGRWAAALGQNFVQTGGYVPVAPPLAGAVDRPAGVHANDLQPELRWTPNARAVVALGGEYFGEERGNGTALQNNSTALRQLQLRAGLEAGGTWQASWFGQSETFASSFSSVAADRSSEKLVLEQRVPSLAEGAALEWSADRGTPLGPLHLVAGGSGRSVSAVDAEVAPLAPSPNRDNDGRQQLAGAYAEAEMAPTPTVSFVGALRADRWRNYDAFAVSAGAVNRFADRTSHALSPSLGAVWHPRGPVSLRASAYESFRAPTLNELYRPFRVGNVQTLANPGLAAERYRGGQIGLDAAVGGRGLVRATYFDGTVANAITNVTLASTPAQITQQRQNVGRLRARGEEFDGRWRLASLWDVWGAFTHLNSVVVSAPEAALVGAKTAHVPANAASLRLLFRPRGWTLSLDQRFGGAEFDNDQNTLTLPSYWTTDLFASRRFGSFAPYFAVENLWNRRHAVELTPDALLSAPRLVSGGVRFTWGKD